jgi:hypothetical protein
MEMTQFTTTGASDFKLRRHCKAIRENQLSVAFMILYLHGYEFDLKRAGKPLASAAMECLEEIGSGGTEEEKQAQVDIYSCSTKAGGIWTTEQRHMLKFGVEK